VSTKGSHPTIDPPTDHTHINVPNQYELYVEDDPSNLVAIG